MVNKNWNKSKETKGYNKLCFLLGDLRENKNFRKELRELVKKGDYLGIRELMADCGIPFCSENSPTDRIGLGLLQKGYEPEPETFDMCQAYDIHYTFAFKDCVLFPKCSSKKEAIKFMKENWKIIKDRGMQEIYRSIYPVVLDIHRLASKRDVLDYIEKKWKTCIEPELSRYWEDNKQKRIVIRKKKERDNLIYKLWQKPKKELDKLDKECNPAYVCPAKYKEGTIRRILRNKYKIIISEANIKKANFTKEQRKLKDCEI